MQDDGLDRRSTVAWAGGWRGAALAVVLLVGLVALRLTRHAPDVRASRAGRAADAGQRVNDEPNAADLAEDGDAQRGDGGEDSALPPLLPLPVASTTAPKPKPSASAAPPRKTEILSTSDAEMEMKLLERAQLSLIASPEAALALANEDVRRYPAGPLRQDAEVIAIEALVRTGHRAVAEARARAFRATYPTSTHLRRIDAVLGTAP